MRQGIFIFILFTFISYTYAQDIEGRWQGKLKVQGTELTIVFNIEKSDNGYSSTLDSPDQGAFGIPVSSTQFDPPNLKVVITNLGAEYTGTLGENGDFAGTFKQAGLSFPLDLSQKPVEIKAVNRPQEPKEPYPYVSIGINFRNEKEDIELSGTLTKPSGEGVFPAVILISGSGPQNRDEEIFNHKPFLVIADYLTKNGIAVLRFDERGVGESSGDFSSATTFDLATDVEYALAYLISRPDIKKDQVGLIGHSEGGMIAPIVASRNPSVSFIVLLAGTGIRGSELLLKQQELIFTASGASEDIINKNFSFNNEVYKLILESNNSEDAKESISSHVNQILIDNPDKMPLPNGMNSDDFVKLLLNQLLSPWMYNFIKYDPSEALRKVKCPVFALNGAKDLQVPAEENLHAIKVALESGGNLNVNVKEFAGLNHLFQECETGLPGEYGKIEQTISPTVLKEISDWITKTLNDN